VLAGAMADRFELLAKQLHVLARMHGTLYAGSSPRPTRPPHPPVPYAYTHTLTRPVRLPAHFAACGPRRPARV
jgi:hypothetical protein